MKIISDHIDDINMLKTISDSVFPVGFGDKTVDISEVSQNYDLLEDKTDPFLFNMIDGPVKNGIAKKDTLIDMLVADSKGLNYLKFFQYYQSYVLVY